MTGMLLHISILLILVFLINLIIKITNGKRQNSIDEFFKKEQITIYTPRHEIEKEIFINVDTKVLNSIYINESNLKLSFIKDHCLKHANKDMIYPLNMSNTEIKLKYGNSNLENIALFESNYNKFMASLVSFGNSLFKHNLYNEAITVLEYAISYKCDVSKCFFILIDCYSAINDSPSLDKLKNKITSGEIECNNIFKDDILAKIKQA